MLCGLVNTCCILNHRHSFSHLHAPIMSQNQSPNFCVSHKITGQCPFTFLLVTPKALLLACHPSHPYLYNTLIFSEVPLCWILDPEDGNTMLLQNITWQLFTSQQCHTPVDLNLQQHCCCNLVSWKAGLISVYI